GNAGRAGAGGLIKEEGEDGGDTADVQTGHEEAVAAADALGEKDDEKSDEGGTGEEGDGIHRNADQGSEKGGINGGKEAHFAPQDDGQNQGAKACGMAMTRRAPDQPCWLP